MGNDGPLPTAQSNANTINGDLNDIDPFKSKTSIANSPPTTRKNEVLFCNLPVLLIQCLNKMHCL